MAVAFATTIFFYAFGRHDNFLPKSAVLDYCFTRTSCSFHCRCHSHCPRYFEFRATHSLYAKSATSYRPCHPFLPLLTYLELQVFLLEYQQLLLLLSTTLLQLMLRFLMLNELLLQGQRYLI